MDITNNVFIITVAFLFGTMVGSFLNVVIYRVPKKMSIVRDRALIAVMTGCGLRRFEISDLKITQM